MMKLCTLLLPFISDKVTLKAMSLQSKKLIQTILLSFLNMNSLAAYEKYTLQPRSFVYH